MIKNCDVRCWITGFTVCPAHPDRKAGDHCIHGIELKLTKEKDANNGTGEKVTEET